ncbi:MAG: hypothetical protein NC218_05425, partial [Acetobacter sp.]|nr:hypothetical protein [Acetobacter sp.]
MRLKINMLLCGTFLSFPAMAAHSGVNVDYLSGLTGAKLTWEEVDEKGDNTVEIDGKRYQYTYHKPNNYENVTERINNTLATADVTNKLFEGFGGNFRGSAIYNTQDNSLIDIKADFVKNTSTQGGWLNGVVVSNTGKIGSITGDFVGNYVENGASVQGFIGQYQGEMKDVQGNFVGNRITSTSGVLGGVINSASGKIGDITGNFIGNSVSSATTSEGGVVYAGVEKGKTGLGNITGNFIGNSVEGKEVVNAGAIGIVSYYANAHNVFTAGDISGLMAYNHAKSENNLVRGGALWLKGRYGQINVDFIGNYAESIYGEVNGGAANINDAYIQGINGDFIGNYAKSTYDTAFGGALYHIDYTDTPFIRSAFINNSVIGGTKALGGAIYTEWTYDENGYSYIRDLRGSFTGNSAETTGEEGKAYGGAIANTRGGYISMTNTSFTDNYAKGNEAKGGAIYNNGVINANADGEKVVFSGNYVEAEGTKRNEAIYAESLYDGYRAELNFKTANGGVIRFEDSISGNDYDISISGDESGEVVFNSKVSGAAEFDVKSGAVYHLGKNAVLDVVNYTADNATLKLDIAVGDNNVQSGVINVSGDVIGNTKVIVNAENPATYEDARTIFVSAPNYDKGTAEQFDVARVIGSPYMWRSVMNVGGEIQGSHWYLSLTDDKNPDFTYAPEVGAYAGLQSAAVEQNRSIAGSVASGLAYKKSINCYEES